MTVSPTLNTHMKTLRLSGMLDSLDVRLEQARSANLGYLEFLGLIIQDEVERREANKLNQRLKRAAFEEPKAIEDFDFASLPGINIAAIKDLATGLFVTRKEHVILYGPPGVGETHLAQALGNQACRTGYSALFIKTAKLFRGLNAARADGTWEKAFRKLLAPDNVSFRPETEDVLGSVIIGLIQEIKLLKVGQHGAAFFRVIQEADNTRLVPILIYELNDDFIAHGEDVRGWRELLEERLFSKLTTAYGEKVLQLSSLLVASNLFVNFKVLWELCR